MLAEHFTDGVHDIVHAVSILAPAIGALRLCQKRIVLLKECSRVYILGRPRVDRVTLELIWS